MRALLTIQRDVIDELRWDPRIHSRDINVVERAGVVTLSGTVATYAEKWAAERAAERVAGVRAMESELAVALCAAHVRSDADLAHRILDGFRWDVHVPDDRLDATVAEGWVHLDGSVEWQYEKDAAERVVRNITGVRGITDSVRVAPTASVDDVRCRIGEALRRQGEEQADGISVQADEYVVTLRGTVSSFAERRAAEVAAWSAPGVREVRDEIRVGT